MDRRAPIVFAVGLAAGVGAAFALGDAPLLAASKTRPKHAVTLHLRAIDPIKRRALVELGGVSRAPAPNLFTFTDDRGRHFVAVSARCQEEADGARECELEIPAGYEKHALKELVLHLHGLHGRTVEVPPDEIAGAAGHADDGQKFAAPDGGAP